MGFKRSKGIGVRAGGFQKEIVPPSNIVDEGGGGRYQGVGSADEVMVACSPNHLLGLRRVKDLQNPP